MTAFISSLSLLGKIYFGFALVGSFFFGLKFLSLIIGISHDSPDMDTDGIHSAVDNLHLEAPHDVDMDMPHDVDLPHDIDMDMPHDVEVSHDLALHDDVDAPNDLAEASNYAYFSVQNIASFSMMFGIIGLSMLRCTQFGELASLIAALIAGILTSFIATKLVKSIYSLRSSGNERKSSALFNTGTVYLTIPPEGVGEIEVEVDGRLRICDAVSANHEELKTGDKIKVVMVDKDGIMSVERVSDE